MPRRAGPESHALDIRINDAEDAAYASYGLQRSTKYLAVETGAGQVEVRISIFGGSSEQPPILLLHGIGSAQVLAAPLIPYFGGRQVIALDWPGHGLSGPCNLAPTQDMRAHASAVIESVLARLRLETVDLVGHSMGAQFSLYAGLDLDDRVRRLVLLGAPGAAFQGIRPLTAMKVLAIPKLGPLLLSRPMSERAFNNFNDLALGPDALAPHSDVQAALRLIGLRTDNASSLASYFAAMVKGGKIRDGVALSVRELGRIKQPTCLAWGDDDVFLTPLQAARSIVALRDTRALRVRGAGHAPWLQATQLVGQHLGQFLDD